jgi:hypothetical protein
MTLQETLAAIAASGLPLQGKFDALKFEFETRLAPPADVEDLHRATKELIASGVQDRALKIGDDAPLFTRRPVFLAVYPVLDQWGPPRVA